MRAGDPQDVKQVYQEKRALQTIYGILITIIGFALLCWMPAPDHVRLGVGGAVVLLGGMIVNEHAVKEWLKIILPFVGRKDNGK